MAEVVVIDGREFAVGDVVLTYWRNLPPGSKKWKPGIIYRIELNDACPIKVRCTDRTIRPCYVSEVHSIRENFA